jgi:hypothetical protein
VAGACEMSRAVWLAAFLLAVACAGVGAEEPANTEASMVTMQGFNIPSPSSLYTFLAFQVENL